MPRPLAICLEDIDNPSEDVRFVRCVAKAGRGDGLALDARGQPQFGRCGVCELVVSLDERLMLVRHEESVPIIVHRAGRSLLAPLEQRVILRDQDEVQIAHRRLRVHVHGPAPQVHPPRPLSARAMRTAASVAAVMALGAGTAGCKDKHAVDPIDVRYAPPEPIEPPPPPEDASAELDEPPEESPTSQ
jgi:hypothetical protein